MAGSASGAGAGVELGAGGDQAGAGQPGQCGGEQVRGGGVQAVQLVDRGGAGFLRAVAGHAEGADGFGGAGAGFRDAGGFAGEHSAGGADGVDRVGFAVPAAGAPVGPVDLDHGDRGGAEVPGQAGAVAAGALDTDVVQPAVAAEPGEHLLVTGEGGGELLVAEDTAGAVQGGGVVGTGVGVHTGGDLTLPRCHARDAVLLAGDAHRRAGVDNTVMGPLGQAPIKSRPPGGCTKGGVARAGRRIT